MTGQGSAGSKSHSAAVAGILLLSVLWSLGPLRSDLLPHATQTPAPPLETATILFAPLAMISALWAVARREPRPRGRDLWTIVAIGLGLFAAPALLVSIASGRVSSLTRVALFSLVPVFAVVFEPYIGGDSLRPARAALAAALAAMAGTLCIFPLDAPGSLEGGAAFLGLIFAAAFVAAANCAAVQIASNAQSLAPMVAISCGSAAVVLALVNTCLNPQPWQMQGLDPLWLLAVELPSLLLLFWLMRRASATAMTTRYLLAPLIAILVDMAISRPIVTARIGLGLLLVVGGAGWMLLAPPAASEDATHPLSLV
jgi:drug/metabolite transporter (DMT)-like permease